MSIQFNVNNLSTGAQTIQSLNTSRVEKILNAGSLNEAQRMGFFDKIKDRFRGGVKAEAIRQLYDQVTAPQLHDAQPINMLHRFERLRALATDEHQAQFTAEVQTGKGEQEGEWTFSFSVDGVPIYQSEILEDCPSSSASYFTQAVLMYKGINDSIERFRNGARENEVLFREVNRFIEVRIDSMADYETDKQKILDNLDNPLVCQKNLQGIEVVEPGKVFRATFAQEGHEPLSFLFSDRKGTNHEFRAWILKDALQRDAYPDLRTLLSKGHLSEDDNAVVYAHSTVDAIRDLMGVAHMKANAAEMFAFVRDFQPVNNPYFQKLGAEKYGAVSLLSLCLPGQTQAVDQLVRFDNARSLLTPTLLSAVTRQAAGYEQVVFGRTLNEYAMSNTQELVDSDSQRRRIIENFDNPLYSRQNFKGIEPGDTNATFKAIFQQEGEEPQVLELSNRAPSNGEYRGSFVKNILQTSEYVNLREMLSVGFMGPQDPMVFASAKAVLASMAEQLELSDTNDLRAFLKNLQQHGPSGVAQETFEMLRNTQYADTNLLILLMGDLAPSPPQPSALLIQPSSLA